MGRYTALSRQISSLVLAPLGKQKKEEPDKVFFNYNKKKLKKKVANPSRDNNSFGVCKSQHNAYKAPINPSSNLLLCLYYILFYIVK